MRIAGVLLSALLYALAFPPMGWSALAWLALVPLLLVVRDQSPRSAFYFGCLFGYAFGWSTMWALAEAAARYFELPLAAGIAGVGLYYFTIAGIPCGVFCLGAHTVLRTRTFSTSLWAIPAMWVGAELVRGRLFMQPWALFGYSQHDEVALLQVATWTGVYGVSFVLAMANVGLAEAAHSLRRGPSMWSPLRLLLAPAGVVAAVYVGGTAAMRMDHGPQGNPRRVAIVQTNIAPSLRWTRSYINSQIAAHLRATNDVASSAHPDLIVWPESAVPRYLETEPGLSEVIRRTARQHGADLLFGVPRYQDGQSFNSVRLITAAGHDGGHYDKQRLVPLAEERPTLFSGGPAEDPESFVPGKASPVLESFARLGISVCHEIIHPDLVDDAVRQGAELLINVANDGWVGNLSTGAAEQHLSMAVFRAIETRRFLVRAAITGVSAVIDPYGRMVGSVPAGEAGVLVASVRGRTAITFYTRFGDVFASLCLAAGLTFLAAQLLRAPRPLATAPVVAAQASV
jgi:apolipoprotein N-acyltransferase